MNDSSVFNDGDDEEPELGFVDEEPLEGVSGGDFDYHQDKLSRLTAEASNELTAYDAVEKLQRQKAGQIAKDALRDHYEDEFDLESPPESLDRYEKMITLRRLELAVVENGKKKSAWRSEANTEGLPDPELASELIQSMKTYGELSEQHLATLTNATVLKSEVRHEASKALAELRSDAARGHESLRAALAAWIRPGGDD